MQVLKVGESRYFQAALLVEREGPPPDHLGGPCRVVAVPQTQAGYPPPEFTTSGGGVISVTAENDLVKVTGLSGGRSTLNVRVYYPDDPTSAVDCAEEFLVYQNGSPNDIFGACLVDAGGPYLP